MSTAPRQTEAQRLANRLSHDATTILRIDAEYAGVLLIRQDELLGQALEALESSRVIKADHLTLESYGEAVQKRNGVIDNIRAHREAK